MPQVDNFHPYPNAFGMACSDFGGATCWERPPGSTVRSRLVEPCLRVTEAFATTAGQAQALAVQEPRKLKKNRRKQQEVRDIPKKMGKVLKSLWIPMVIVHVYIG